MASAPKIDLRRRSVPDVGSMRDIVIIATTVERPDGNVSTVVERPGVIRVHARVRDLRPEEVLNYQAVFGSQDRLTKLITIRLPRDVKIDLNHWVYKLTGYDRAWYKVGGVENLGGADRFLVLYCSLSTVNDSRSDPATQEPPPKWEEPTGFPRIVDRI